MATHLSFFCVASFGFSQGDFAKVNPPLFLELTQSAQNVSAAESVQTNIAKETVIQPLPETMPAEKELSHKEDNHSKTIAKPDWDRKEFDKKQIEIDQKIKTIRRQLRRAVSQQKLKAKSARGFEVVAAGIDGDVWSRYLADVRQKILKKWYPRLSDLEKELVPSEARLDFDVSDSGQVKRERIVEWKGSPAFRELCLEAFRRSLPLDPLPAGKNKQEKDHKRWINVSLFFYFQA